MIFSKKPLTAEERLKIIEERLNVLEAYTLGGKSEEEMEEDLDEKKEERNELKKAKETINRLLKKTDEDLKSEIIEYSKQTNQLERFSRWTIDKLLLIKYDLDRVDSYKYGNVGRLLRLRLDKIGFSLENEYGYDSEKEKKKEEEFKQNIINKKEEIIKKCLDYAHHNRLKKIVISDIELIINSLGLLNDSPLPLYRVRQEIARPITLEVNARLKGIK